jgi:hypothetical protein
MLIKRWQGPPVLVIVPCPPEPSVAIGAPKGGGPVWCWIPEGSIAPRALTNAEKKFLLRQRMDGGLFKSGRVLAVSKEAASRFETDRKARVDLAKNVALTEVMISFVLRLRGENWQHSAPKASTKGEPRGHYANFSVANPLRRSLVVRVAPPA